MKTRAIPLIAILLICAVGSSAQPGQDRQTPSLVAAEEKTIRDSRGDGAQSFQISSTILRETRRIYAVLPISYSQNGMPPPTLSFSFKRIRK